MSGSAEYGACGHANVRRPTPYPDLAWCHDCGALRLNDESGWLTTKTEDYPDPDYQLAELARETRALVGGWREVIAELDDMAKNEALGKAMWAALGQIDNFKTRYDVIALRQAQGSPNEAGGQG